MFNGSIALIGESGSGKTTQIGEVAKWLKKEHNLKTALFTNERGGYDSIAHLVELGVIDVVQYDFESDPFVWSNHVCKGERLENGIWIPHYRDEYGLWAFDSGTAHADEAMNKLSQDAGKGKSVGGASSFNVKLAEGEGNVASNTQTHYGLVQTFMRNNIWKSQRLPGMVLWTFTLDRSEKADETQVAGPKLAGHSMTTELPRYFRYTFRIAEELNVGEAAKHVLYLQSHTSGTLGSYGNARVPIEGFEELGTVISPASLVEAIERIQRIKDMAKERTRVELGL